MTTYSVLSFEFFINGGPVLKGDNYGFRDSAILTFLYTAISLEPLNLFLYTWRLLETLERDANIICLKRFYRIIATTAVCLLPIGFYAIVAADAIEEGLNKDYNS